MNSKFVPLQVLRSQVELVRDAIGEEPMFSIFLEDLNWPPQMNTVQPNLIRTTRMDNEISTNRENGHYLPPMILNDYKRHFLSTFGQKLAKCKEMCNSDPLEVLPVNFSLRSAEVNGENCTVNIEVLADETAFPEYPVDYTTEKQNEKISFFNRRYLSE